MTEENHNDEADVEDAAEQESKNIDELLNKAREDFKIIEEFKTKIESHSEDLSSLKKSAEDDSKAASTARERTEEIEKVIQNNKDLTNKLLAEVKKERDDAIALLEKIKKHEADAKLIADTADEKDAKVNEYEEQLKKLITQYRELNEKIESLLPGATSAGLAYASKTRKDSFKWPKVFWTILQIFSVGLLVGVGFWVLAVTKINNFGELIFFILERSPIIAAIILLEEFARRNRNIAFRLEEDYGYKEVLSSSFEGYKKQMQEIDDKASAAVSALSTNLLEAMAQEPGRLIDKEKPVSIESSLLESTISQFKGQKGESNDKLLIRIYEDLKRNIRGDVIKVAILIAIAIAAGIGIGYYIWRIQG